MKGIGLFIGIALVLLFIGTALAQFNRSMMFGQPPAILRVESVASAGTAYYLSGINTAVIAKNNLATSGGVQYLCYYNTANPPSPKFLLRTLNTNAVTFVDPGLPAQGLTPTDDEHGECSIAIDNGGFLHVSYGQHGSAVGLNYYKSNNPVTTTTVGGPFTKLSMVAGNGTIESSVTYPFFIKSPTTGELYFSFRYLGSGDGNQYFYHYTTGTTTWSAAAGTGTGGLLINDHANTTVTSPYLNGLPKWDASGNLWFNWQEWDAVAGAAHNQYLVAWTGAAFVDVTGSAVTVPILTQSLAPIVVIPASANANVQNDFTINKGVFYIPYLRQDGGGIYQVYVAESSSGAFVEHQLTSNTSNPSSGCGTPATMPCAAITGPTAVGNGDGSVYVVYPDLFSTPPGKGVIAAKSSNKFASFTNQVLFSSYTPNFAMNLDPTRIGSIASFMKMDSADYQFGFWSGSTPAYTFGNQGSMLIYDWTLAYTPGTPIGGGGGGVPALAAKAGFTTQVLKADFTVPGNFWSNTSNYMTNSPCNAPHSTPQVPSTWAFTFSVWSTQVALPCSRTIITSDPDQGGQVLEQIMTPTDLANTNNSNAGEYLSYPAHVGEGSSNSWLPNEFYVKIVIRIRSAGYSQGGGIFGLYDWYSANLSFGTNFYDEDYAEIRYTGTGAPLFFTSMGNSSDMILSPTLDPTQYHTIESLVTSDESTIGWICLIYDGTPTSPSCASDSKVNTLKDRGILISVNPNNPTMPNEMDVLIKSIEIWACANYATATCPGTLVTTFP